MSWFSWLWNKMKHKKPTPTPVPVPVDNTKVWDFTKGLSTDWRLSDWVASGNTRYTPSYVKYIPGVGLQLRLTQTLLNGVLSSVGAELSTFELCGFGTYEFVLRASSSSPTADGPGSAVSGSVTGAFSYIDQHLTEIDFETLGDKPGVVYYTTWIGPTTNQSTSSPVPGIEEGFHTYKFIWSKDKIDFYVDNVLQQSHTQLVPTIPAPIFLNHWGTGDPAWGGLATPGADRFVYVKSVSYKPA